MSTPSGWGGVAASQGGVTAQGGSAPSINVGGVSQPQTPQNPFQIPSLSSRGPSGSTPWGPGSPGYGVTYTPVNTSQQQAVNEFQTWDDKELSNFRNYMGMLNSNYLTAPTYDTGQGNSLQAAWSNYVAAAAQRSTALGKPISPWDLIAGDVAAASGNAAKAGKTLTKTTSQVNLTTRADAQAIFYQAAQQLLGRAPTDSEVANFQGFLNAKERANPIVTTKDTTYNEFGQVTDQNITKQSGGVSSAAQQMIAMQEAQKNPEYGAYQAATTYMQALKQAIGG